MKINAELVLEHRKANSWSQEELAIAAGLNLRTIQRIESDGMASLQSKKALASAFDLEVSDLDLTIENNSILEEVGNAKLNTNNLDLQATGGGALVADSSSEAIQQDIAFVNSAPLLFDKAGVVTLSAAQSATIKNIPTKPSSSSVATSFNQFVGQRYRKPTTSSQQSEED